MWAPRSTPIATHHADYSAEESISSIITSLHRYAADAYHPTRVYKVTLIGMNDEVVDLVDWLAMSGTKTDMPVIGRPASKDAVLAKKSRLPIRHFALSSHRLTERGYAALAELVRSHGSLTVLDLTMNNNIMPLPRLTTLPSAITNSNLRKVILSSTPLYADSFCHLIDNLRSTSLRELRLSLAIPATSITREESRRCALSIAKMVRPKQKGEGSADALECGDTPQLELLTLNGDQFTLKGIKMIVAAIVGSSYWPGNTTLTHVELFATCSADDQDSEDEEEQNNTGQSTSNGSRRRTTSISRAYLEARRAELHGVLNNNSASTSGATSFTSSAHSQLENTSPSNRKLYSHINAFNWRHLLGSHLWNNTQNRSGVIYSALSLLAAARIMGCRSRCETDSGTSLLRLPAEIRLHILRHVADESSTRATILSRRQFDRVISFACDSRTIGFGSAEWDWESVPREAPSSFPSLIPARSFEFPHTYKDYDAEAWDTYQSQQHSQASMPATPMATKHPGAAAAATTTRESSTHDIGGGGGPDGLGGAGSSSRTPPVIVNGGGQEDAGVWNHRRRGMPDPEMLAFLEVCGCRSVDPWW